MFARMTYKSNLENVIHSDKNVFKSVKINPLYNITKFLTGILYHPYIITKSLGIFLFEMMYFLISFYVLKKDVSFINNFFICYLSF